MKNGLWTSLSDSIDDFSSKLLSILDDLGIMHKCKQLSIDHICVRFRDPKHVDQLREELSKIGRDISTTIVNGRLISIFQLNQPLKIGPWSVQAIEVPYPKKDHHYNDGWEHVEFVLPNAGNTMVELKNSFVTFFSQDLSETQKNIYEYSENEPHAEAKQLPNPTISLKVNGVGIKFHTRPIQQVVGFQKVGMDSGLMQ